MNAIDKSNINKFIHLLEQEAFVENVDKIQYLNYILKNAKDLISVGEYKIALENLLENLLEESLIPPKDISQYLVKIEDKDIQFLLTFF